MAKFPTTQWSWIELAQADSALGSMENIGKLLEAYRQPMFSHLLFKGMSHEKAEDIIQEFMLEILQKDFLSVADPKKGKFRTLLLTALDRFVVSKYRFETAARRSPGQIAQLDEAGGQIAPDKHHGPDSTFERAWAMEVLAQALATMKIECEENGDHARWSVFEGRILAPLFDGAAVPEYAALAERYSLPNEKSAMNLLVTGKRQFERILKGLIKEYVTHSSNLDKLVDKFASELSEDYSQDKTAHRVAKNLVDNAIALAIEEELDFLMSVLASKSANEIVEREDKSGKKPYISEFWQRLTRPQKSDSEISSLLTVDDSPEVPVDVHYQSVINTNGGDLVNGLQGTIRQCLCESKDIESIEKLKSWSNTERLSNQSMFPREIVNVIYYASIAAALSRFGQKITGTDDRSLHAAMKNLHEFDWLDDPIRELITRGMSCIS